MKYLIKKALVPVCIQLKNGSRVKLMGKNVYLNISKKGELNELLIDIDLNRKRQRRKSLQDPENFRALIIRDHYIEIVLDQLLDIYQIDSDFLCLVINIGKIIRIDAVLQNNPMGIKIAGINNIIAGRV